MEHVSVTGKKVNTLKIFQGDGTDFSAYGEAIKFIKENGMSAGSMQREAPIGLMKGEFIISKWRNMHPDEIQQLNGTISFPDGSARNGRAVVEIYED